MQYIKINFTEKMEKELEECAEMWKGGKQRNCEGCSLNGGDEFGCFGEYPLHGKGES